MTAISRITDLKIDSLHTQLAIINNNPACSMLIAFPSSHGMFVDHKVRGALTE